MTHLTTIELFAGIGGFSTPYTTPLAFVEKEPTCRAILRRHYPQALILDDVRTAGAHNLPWANIIKFGFPCQDLSVAGNRAGLAGQRSGLFYEATRIVDELRPDYAVWENVPGLLSSDSGRDFARVLLELERIGYCGSWTMLDAQFFGVAQRRQRVFGVFARRDVGAQRTAEILSLAARLPWNTPTGSKARASVAAAVAASAGHHGHSSPRGDGSDNLISFNMHSYAQDANPAASVGETLAADHGIGITAVFGGNNTAGERGVAAALNAKGGAGRMDFESENFVVAGALSASHGGADDTDAQAQHLVAVSVAQNQRGELRTDGRGSQLTTGGGKPGEGYAAVLTFQERGREGGRAQERNIAGAFGVRRLTPRECERLQGFDDDWTAWGIDEQGQRVEMSDSVRYRMLGNAVCRKVSAWIDRQIVRHTS